MFLPEHWPSYFSKAKDCSVWDLDGKELLDMSIMGIGTNSLGYGNDEVDAAKENDDAIPQSPVIARDHEGQELPGMELDVMQNAPVNVSSSVFAASVP